jgi:hypothetical protein
MKLKYYLIAGPENHYEPWITSKTAMACFILGIWALRLFVPNNFAASNPGIDPQDLMVRVNLERTNRLMPALTQNSKLNTAANIKSADMIERSYFSHVDPDGNYVWPVIEAQGYAPYQALGENLAIDFVSGEAVVNAWMNSPGHRANILNENFEDQGMGAVLGEYEPGHQTYLITNLFGKLLKQTHPVPPAETPPPAPAEPVASASTESTAQTQQPESTTPPAEPENAPDTQAPEVSEPVQMRDPAPAPSSQIISAQDKKGLVPLKMVMILFASVYTLFLAIDSVIIHQAKLRRENLPSSPHTLMMLLFSAANYFTIFW